MYHNAFAWHQTTGSEASYVYSVYCHKNFTIVMSTVGCQPPLSPIVMGTGVRRLPDATHVITTGGCPPPMQRIGLGYTEGT
jgi:hypothetical protein